MKKIYKFYKPNCSPCSTLVKMMATMNIPNDFEFIELNVEDEKNKQFAYDNGIDKTPSLMFEDGKTIIDVNGKSQKEIEFKIREMTENYEEVSNYIIKKFNTVSNFDEEFIAIKSFMANLV